MAAELNALPFAMRLSMAGAAFSAVSLFAVATRHLQVQRDLVAIEYNRLKDRTSGEVQELVIRANGVWNRASASRTEQDENRKLLEEAVMRLFHTARRWSDIDNDNSSLRASALVDRMESLDRRIEAADDNVVRNFDPAHVYALLGTANLWIGAAAGAGLAFAASWLRGRRIEVNT
jgi:hypothetical protein